MGTNLCPGTSHKIAGIRAILFVACHLWLNGSVALGDEESSGRALPVISARQVEKVFPFGGLDIAVLEKVSSDKGAVDIRIAVKRGDKAISELLFKQAQASGGYAGVSVARRTILGGLFLLQKAGSYDDRLVVVTEKGKTFSLPDGDAFFAPSAKLLFAIRSDEVSEPAFSVLDLKEEKTLVSLQGKDCRKLFDEGFVYIMTSVDGVYLAEAYRNLGSKDPKAPEQSRFVIFDPRDKSVKRYDKIDDLPVKERKQVTELTPIPAMGDTSVWVPVR